MNERNLQSLLEFSFNVIVFGVKYGLLLSLQFIKGPPVSVVYLFRMNK